MKRIIFYTIITLFLSLGLISCGDSFLDERVYSYYVPGHADATTIEAQIMGLHLTFAELWGWSGQQGFLSCWQIGTDVASAGATQGVEVPFYQYANLNSENAGVQYLWSKCYDFINNANIIISTVGENNKSAAAEAKFFRAYAYNILVTLWGNVPLIDEAITVPRTDFTRQKIADVDQLIDDDLTYAIANLPEVGKAADESRINKDMARQLAGEAYLRMGMRDNSYFAKAEQVLTDIIESKKYTLIDERYGDTSEAGDYYHDMFKWGKQRRSQGNTEAIWTFEMEYNRNVNGGTIDNPQHRRVWQPAYHKWDGMVNCDSLGGRGNGRLRLSNFMKYGLYEKGDIRNSNYNIRRYTYYNRPNWSAEIGIDAKGFRVDKSSPKAVRVITVKTGDRAIPYETDSLEVWYPHTTKWGAYDVTDDFGYAVVKDWPVMRFGETYLLRAEARFRQDNLSGAAEDINKLRDRAFKIARQQTGNPNLGKISASDITLDFILDERARELIGEENRRMTLVRTGMLAERIEKNGDKVPYAPENKVITGFQNYNVLLPIPLTEIQLNKDAALEQNPGY
ncbi:MAG: RagB/SusD family nutrient uptake outer membrane protein [Dysgonomonadaceae bacterium]|nr:RagB/SusD family nutrient uptake outer membrane protein [Dysgonamonadaceae bacterium]HOV35803.1 RagB/SusD family nutrient uptake outer membrane protein [Dysgonamonadaceae bacterium]HQG07416.1 RagB/SusD family nutrient uptake outer membrane protein [Dysgonamonadaceae bacterium]HQI43023.1 RagB/SusD family nutrient uptake outer membrane protein [Dysgonamonadaceae bacterium]